MRFDLAQVNIARLAAPLDSAQLAGFVAALDPVNALADGAPGFVWRLVGEGGNATQVQAFRAETADGAGIITNLSTWADVGSLAAFVYGPMHAAIMRRRREWFLQIREAYVVCWWVPGGHRPATAEAEDRLEHLRRHGPTPDAFTLRQHYPAPGAAAVPSPVVRDDWLCDV